MTKLWLLRHAPAVTQGRLAGRRDVPADLSDQTCLAALGRKLRAIPDAAVLSSPAQRCLQTCAALSLTPMTRAELWEQDFGLWEDIPATEIPDLGPLSPQDLARHRPPQGESFDDMCARVMPVLQALHGPTIIVAHAGTVRAALALAVGPAALSFAVHPLSLTAMQRTETGWAVEKVNCGGIA